MNPFKAVVVREENGVVTHGVETITLDQLSQGDVLIKVAYSSVNYKDALAVKEKTGVIRNYPMVPGIDLSGTVVSSTDPSLKEGQEVLVTGFDMGMSHTGGFSEYARVPANWVVPLPKGLSMRDAMIVGTAGLTAAIAIVAMEKAGMDPKNDPVILVTGASGGVGSTAIQFLAKSGYKNVCALTRKKSEADKLKALGAAEVLEVSEVASPVSKPLVKERFHFILDTVGGDIAAALIPQISYGGSISMCGNAAGIQLNINVLPFILRGVSLLGIDSVYLPSEARPAIWARFAQEWDIMGDSLVHETDLYGLTEVFEALRKGQHVGRTIVKIGE